MLIFKNRCEISILYSVKKAIVSNFIINFDYDYTDKKMILPITSDLS